MHRTVILQFCTTASDTHTHMTARHISSHAFRCAEAIGERLKAVGAVTRITHLQ